MSSRRNHLSDLHHTFTLSAVEFIPYSTMTNKRSKIFSLPGGKH
ncbi:hypothetical protein HMPREF1502_3876 [Klebsiella sp. AS10]|nr:hypothetical protein HMPREF1502_3876 [Klebsiella sp. AS10]